MLKRLSQREQIANLLDQYSLAIQQAFLNAIADIRSKITLSPIITRLEKGDINGAIDALHIERSAFNNVLDQIGTAYNAGGAATIDNMPSLREPDGARLVIRFDARNTRAEDWLRQHSSDLVTNIVADQKEAILVALNEGLQAGRNPRSTALDIVGRINRVTGNREGGIVGLSSPQERYVAAARAELASGDPAQMANYLTRVRRDKRFDATVRAAIEAEKPVSTDTLAKIIGRYADRLLELRGETIGRTETLTALNAASTEAMQQAIDGGKVQQQVVTSIWHSAHDDRVRDTHRAMDGQKQAFGQPFHSPSGAVLRFPGDPSAPVSETANCRCYVEHKVDFLAGLK